MVVEAPEYRCEEPTFMPGKAVHMPTVSIQPDIPNGAKDSRLGDAIDSCAICVDDEHGSVIFRKNIVRFTDSVEA